jgi:hypothetical protein
MGQDALSPIFISDETFSPFFIIGHDSPSPPQQQQECSPAASPFFIIGQDAPSPLQHAQFS